jgi:hypothetical protein
MLPLQPSMALNLPSTLRRWAIDRAIRTKYTAVTIFPPQHRFTLWTFENQQTGIGQHRLLRTAPTVRAGQNRLTQYVCHLTPFMAHSQGPILDSFYSLY